MPGPLGARHPTITPFQAFKTSDGAIIIACLTNAFWERIYRALGVPELATDPRYDSLEKRRAAPKPLITTQMVPARPATPPQSQARVQEPARTGIDRTFAELQLHLIRAVLFQ